MKKNRMRPVPLGEIREEFLKPLGLTANAPAKAIGVPPNRITAISERMKGHHRGHRDPARNVFQNVAGILDEPANDLRPAQRREGAAGKGEKEHRRQQKRAGMIQKTDEQSVIVPIASREILGGERRKAN
jgi:hypothetical protein